MSPGATARGSTCAAMSAWTMHRSGTAAAGCSRRWNASCASSIALPDDRGGLLLTHEPQMTGRRPLGRLGAPRLFLEVALDGGQGRLAGSAFTAGRSVHPVLPVCHGVYHFYRQVLGPDLSVAGTVAGDPEHAAPGKDAAERPAAERKRRLDALIRDVEIRYPVPVAQVQTQVRVHRILGRHHHAGATGIKVDHGDTSRQIRE